MLCESSDVDFFSPLYSNTQIIYRNTFSSYTNRSINIKSTKPTENDLHAGNYDQLQNTQLINSTLNELLS